MWLPDAIVHLVANCTPSTVPRHTSTRRPTSLRPASAALTNVFQSASTTTHVQSCRAQHLGNGRLDTNDATQRNHTPLVAEIQPSFRVDVAHNLLQLSIKIAKSPMRLLREAGGRCAVVCMCGKWSVYTRDAGLASWQLRLMLLYPSWYCGICHPP